MVFWIGAAVVAIVIAVIAGVKLFRRTADPAWPAAVTFGLAALAALGSAVFATVASLEEPARPPAVASAEGHGGDGGATENASFEQLVTKLETDLKTNPDRVEGWALLGRSYVAMGRLDDAVAAFREAVDRSDPASAEQLGELAEALVAAANGRVAGEPEALFAQILTLQPGDPRARFYLAQAMADKGDVEGARRALTAMLRTAPADAPWRATVFERLQELSPPDERPAPPADVAVTPEGAPAPGPTQEQMQAAADMSPEDREEMIRGMVDGLAERMQENPDDFRGWLRLANSYMVLKDEAKAAEALKSALALQPANIGLLVQYAEVEIAANGGTVTEAAETAMRRALDRQPGNPQAMWRLGQAALQKGDKEEARRLWSELHPKLLVADPLKAEVQAALDAL